MYFSAGNNVIKRITRCHFINQYGMKTYGIYPMFSAGVVCLVCFVISLAFATSTGPYVFDLFDSYCANIPLLVVAFMECVAISYKYGLKK